MSGLPTIHYSWQTIAAIDNLQGSEEIQKAIRLDPNRSSSYISLATLQVKQTSEAQGRYKLRKPDFAGPKIADAPQ